MLRTWRDPSQKLALLRARLDTVPRGELETWQQGASGVAEFVAEQIVVNGKRCTFETVRSALARCTGAGFSAGTLPAHYFPHMMRAFGVAADGSEWFVDGAIDLFSDKFAEAKTIYTPSNRGQLTLKAQPLENVWHDEIRSDVGPVQGSPMGLVVEVAARPLRHDARWAYGFKKLTIVFSSSGSGRFEFDPALLGEGVTIRGIQFSKRGVRNREEIGVKTSNKKALDGGFASDVLGTVVDATEGTMIVATTRAVQEDATLEFIGEGEVPSRTRQEIIACIFGESGAPKKASAQFKTLCEQTLLVRKAN